MAASHHELQKPLNPKRCVIPLFLTILFLFQAHSTALGSTQGESPFTKERLVASLKFGGRYKDKRTSKERYIQLIQQQGVNFRVTPADEQTIRKAGAYLGSVELDEIIAAVRSNYRLENTSLSGIIEQVEVTDYPAGGSQVFIRLMVRNNDGPPTIAQKFYLRIRHVTSRSIDFKGPPVRLNERFTLPQKGESDGVVIQPQDALAYKSNEAIGPGKMLRGWLRFVMPLALLKPDVLRQPGIRYVLSFTDAAGKPYEAIYEVR